MKKAGLISFIVILLLFMAACGKQKAEPPSGSPTTSDGKASGSADTSSSDLEYAQKEIDKYRALPEFVPPGPAFDAKATMNGKTILSIPDSSANPFVENIEKTMKAVAESVGFKFTEWSNQGQPSQWVQGMNAAVNQKADLIDMLGGTNPAVLQPQIQEAVKKGIKIVPSLLYGFDQQPAPNVTESLAIDYNKAARLLVDWTIFKTNGKPNVLVLTSNEIVNSESMLNGLKDEFKTRAPSANVTYVNVPVPEWSTKIQSNVQSEIIKNPDLNYIIPIYDSMSQFVVPAITITGSADRVKIATFNGTPFVLDLLRQGSVEMDIGLNLDWIGRAIMDDQMRLLAGLPFVKDEHIPFYIWDKDNINEAGNPAEMSKGYGDSYIEGYNKLWGLSK